MRARAFSKLLWDDLDHDEILDVAAMMTYYAVFALFPMLVFVITVGLLVVPSETIQEGVALAVATTPRDIGTLIAEQVTRMEQAAGAGFAVLSAVVALWGASRGAAALGHALNGVFRKKETRSWWKRQLIAIGVTLAVATMVITALALLVVAPPIGHAIADRFGLGATFDVAWSLGRWIGAALLVLVVLATLYKFLPNTDEPFRVFTPGAIAGVLMWVAVSYGFELYLDHVGDYEETYGTLAGAIVFLLWLWLSNLAILVGAEINDVLAELRKKPSPARVRRAPATPVTT